MQLVSEQLDKDLFCSLHALSAEVLCEFQTYDEDLERPSDKVPFYAIVEAMENAMEELRQKITTDEVGHQARVEEMRDKLKEHLQEIEVLKKRVAELESRPVSYEEVFKKLEKDVSITQHVKLHSEFQKLRTSAFTRKSKIHKLKSEVLHLKESNAELQMKTDWLTREVAQLTVEKDRREAKIAALRDTIVKREALFKDVSKAYEALKSELAVSEKHRQETLAELEIVRNWRDADLTPRPDWGICPWKWDDEERKTLSSRQLLQELVKTIESRPKLMRKKSMKPSP